MAVEAVGQAKITCVEPCGRVFLGPGCSARERQASMGALAIAVKNAEEALAQLNKRKKISAPTTQGAVCGRCPFNPENKITQPRKFYMKPPLR
ncbi:MAG: hypothetical protein QHH09_02840 [Microgenomates group bacterium]|jgi:hypothetical protein|nr:hypothetical protein [Microgenomates group bacterium]